MTIQATRRELLKDYGHSGLAVGYCDAYYLLSYENKLCYTAGVYGWNFDAYQIDGVLITTGYRNLIGKRPQFLDKYEKKAEKIAKDYSLDYDARKKKIKKLLLEWIKKEFQK